MRQIAGRLPSPSLVVAFVALLVALGGGAYAAVNSGAGAVHTCYLKGHGDLRVVSAKAKCAKGEKALTLNRRGAEAPIGTPGPSGPQGLQGATGASGPQGPSAAFSTRVPLKALVVASPLEVAALQLPAGSYVISSTLWMQGASSAPEAISGLICTLAADGDSDRSQVQVQMSKTFNAHVPVALNVNHTGTTPFAATLTCEGTGSASISAVDTELTAIQVGSLSVQQ